MLSADVVVIGAGVSGLVVAKNLVEKGQSVICIEKARGTGGRLSSKRVNSKNTVTRESELWSFDLGASSFKAVTPEFRLLLLCLVEEGRMLTNDTEFWPASRSSSFTRYLSEAVDLHCAQKITKIEKTDQGWLTFTEDEGGRLVAFSLSNDLILATPPEQAYDLIPSDHPYKVRLESVKTQAQWVTSYLLDRNTATALGIQSEDTFIYDDSNIDDRSEDVRSVFRRIVVETQKEGRESDANRVVVKVEASPWWSESKMDWEKTDVTELLWKELIALRTNNVAANSLTWISEHTHRWLYSLPQANPLKGSLFLPQENGLSLCGDYLAIDSVYARDESLEGVESAFISGLALSKSFS